MDIGFLLSFYPSQATDQLWVWYHIHSLLNTETLQWIYLQCRPSYKVLVSCPVVHAPGGGHLVVWLEFLVTKTFLIWNVRWAIKSQNTQLKVAMSSKCKMATQFYSEVCNFCAKERTPCVSIWTGLQPTYFQTSSDGLRVCVSGWGGGWTAGHETST